MFSNDSQRPNTVKSQLWVYTGGLTEGVRRRDSLGHSALGFASVSAAFDSKLTNEGRGPHENTKSQGLENRRKIKCPGTKTLLEASELGGPWAVGCGLGNAGCSGWMMFFEVW